MPHSATSPNLLADEALTLARYLLPEARSVLTVPRVSDRVARDYAAALTRHTLAPLGTLLGGGGAPRAVFLWAWDGLLAPDPTRTVVRQRLLLMTAILESQPELSAFFLPQEMTRLRAVWTLAAAAAGTAVCAVLSVGLLLTRRAPNAA